MLKIAIFSDVHSNLPALEAVLADIEKLNADQIYCLGDLVDFAPWTNEVIDIIKKNRIATIMGNHDERIAFDLPLIPLEKHHEDERSARIEAIEFTRNEITEKNKKFLSQLPRQIRLNFSLGDKNLNILLVHASSRSNDDYIFENHEEEDLLQMLDSNSVDVMVMGHTHLPYIRHIGDNIRKTVVNCGSVGRSKEMVQSASYLMVSISEEGGNHTPEYELRRISYNVHETINCIRESSIPDFYADFLLSGLPG